PRFGGLARGFSLSRDTGVSPHSIKRGKQHMALIEYRINVDANGNAKVIQDVVEIGANDQIRFVSDYDGTYIQFDRASPNPAALPPDTPLQVAALGTTQVTNPNANADLRFVPDFGEQRRTFHFQCGQMDNLNFAPWGGGGGDTSSGGSKGH